MSKKDDRALLAIMSKEPEKGFRLLMAKYKEALYWHIRRLVVTHDDAQDATQETFVRVFRSLNQFKGECSFRSWIYRIATNEALRILSRRQNESLSLEDSPPEVNSLMADEYVDYTDLEAVRLQQAILALPAKQQQVFNLRYYDEMGYDEIAEIVDSTALSAKANYHIAKEKIIKHMNLKHQQNEQRI